MAIATRPRRAESAGEQGVGLGVDARDEERGDRGDGVDRLPARHAPLEAGEVGVDDLLVALDGEQQRDVDVDAAGGELLDRGDPGLGGGNLDHHVGPREALPQLERLLDGRRGVVGEVGRALERDEPVAPVAGVVGRAQQVGGTADVVEREREEELLRVAHARGDRRADLVVVGVRARDRLGEDRGVGGRPGHRAVGDQRREGAAVQQLARERVEPDRDAGVVQLLEAVHADAPCTGGREFLERHVGIGEAPVVDGDALADEALDRVDDVPDVDVHARHDAIAASARRR